MKKVNPKVIPVLIRTHFQQNHPTAHHGSAQPPVGQSCTSNFMPWLTNVATSKHLFYKT